jgi:exodeoxyribonuclease V alpha subunit
MDNSVDKFEDNSVHKLLTVQEQPSWFAQWVDFMTRPPFYTGENTQALSLLLKALCEAMLSGDSCLETDLEACDFAQLIADGNSSAVAEKPLIWDAPYLYLQRYWQLERQVAQQMLAIAQVSVAAIDLQQELALFDDPLQQQALNIGVNSALAIISGGPGTGKTYILTRIVAVLKKHHPEWRIAMAAPTGKAAQRMQEALQLAFADAALHKAQLYHPELAQQKTQTLHRLLGMGQQRVAKYHQDYPLPYDVVVIDEASMLDLTLAHALLQAIKPSTRLILLGDANQLSSVDVGYVLADLQKVPALASHQVTLQHSRRFSDQAQIGQFARFIAQVKQPPYAQQWLEQVQPQLIQAGSPGVQLPQDQAQTTREDQHLAVDWVGYFSVNAHCSHSKEMQLLNHVAQGYDAYIEALLRYRRAEIDLQQLCLQFDQYRILVAMRSGRFGLERINQLLTQYIRQQLQIVEPSEWYEGRAVMMVYNDYQLGLSNGDIGICLKLLQPQPHFSVYFPSLQLHVAAARLPQSIQTAFALTIHKSQGSEFRHVAVILDERAEQLLSRELVYTAITRAKKMVTIYASEQALEQSFARKTSRISGLTRQVQRAFDQQTTADGSV